MKIMRNLHNETEKKRQRDWRIPIEEMKTHAWLKLNTLASPLRIRVPTWLSRPSRKSQNKTRAKKFTFGQINRALDTQILIWRCKSSKRQVLERKSRSKWHNFTFSRQHFSVEQLRSELCNYRIQGHFWRHITQAARRLVSLVQWWKTEKGIY